jgi:hypothetical protein
MVVPGLGETLLKRWMTILEQDGRYAGNVHHGEVRTTQPPLV